MSNVLSTNFMWMVDRHANPAKKSVPISVENNYSVSYMLPYNHISCLIYIFFLDMANPDDSSSLLFLKDKGDFS